MAFLLSLEITILIDVEIVKMLYHNQHEIYAIIVNIFNMELRKRSYKMSNNRKAFVLGMARSGYEAAKLLASKGYEVTVNDAKTDQNIEEVNELQSLGVKIVLGSHPEDLFDSTFEVIVKNPGISNKHKYIEKAHKFNVPVINEIELAFRYFPTGITIIGVTGTNGKTTTTILIYEFLKRHQRACF